MPLKSLRDYLTPSGRISYGQNSLGPIIPETSSMKKREREDAANEQSLDNCSCLDRCQTSNVFVKRLAITTLVLGILCISFGTIVVVSSDKFKNSSKSIALGGAFIGVGCLSALISPIFLAIFRGYEREDQQALLKERKTTQV